MRARTLRARLAVVEEGRAAGGVPVLRDRRHHRLGRLLERGHRGRNCQLGQGRGCGHGLGAYIAEATTAGDFHRIVLGIVTMSLFVVVINRFFWRPLYYYAERKYPADLKEGVLQ